MAFVIIAAVIAAGAAFWYVGARRTRARRREVDESPYHLGLDALIAGNSDGAIEHLTQAVRAGRRFSRALVVNTFEGQTSFSEAFRLLGVRKVETLRRFGSELEVGV